jgi:hypothetical protein
VWDRFAAKVVGLRSWGIGLAAALLGWLALTVLLLAGVRPLGWVLLSVVVATLVGAALYASARALERFEVVGFTFACMLLAWPPLALVTLLLLSWANAATWD